MLTNILDLLKTAKDKYGSATLYYCPTGAEYPDLPEEISFKEFEDMTRAIGSGLIHAISDSNSAQSNSSPTPILVMTGRHLFTPACFLGVARTGNIYAPVDMDVPDSRIVQILKVAKGKFILVDSGTRERLLKILDSLDSESKELVGNPTILLMEDLLETPIDETALSRASESITEFSPLYIIFTSGSTGVPKGVLTSHLALMSYLDGLNEVIKLDSSDVLGNQAPLDYIAAIRDMYLPLLTGCSTLIIPRNIVAMPGELFKTLNEKMVTTLCWSASGLEVLSKLGALDDDENELPKYIKRIVFSGSVMSSKELMKWQHALPSCTFINQYGPTETTASCTYYIIKDTIAEDSVIPIGKPFKHYRVFLLTDGGTILDSNHCADGVGEICVAGPALALGYYNNPEQTSKSFISNPSVESYDERIYLTGDLGKYDSSGDLLFLGRKDRQIKHMGHRIELSDVENFARKVSGIDDAAAMYHEDKSILYLFYSGDATSKEITLSFREEMPAYMVPRKLVKLDAMPHLPNGKLDMPALKELMK